MLGTTADAHAWRRSGLAGLCEGVTVLGDGAYVNTGLVVPHRKRPGRPLLKGEEEDNAEHRKVRARVEHVIGRMKNYKILRDCRQRSRHLGHIKRRDLKLRHIEAIYDAIERENAERLIHHAKVSSFFGSGVKRGEYPTNLAKLVELPAVKRPKALVWTPEQTGQFLDFVSDDRLCAMWHAFIFRGPRRGEMCALSWPEASPDGSWFRISAQIVEIAYRQFNEAPKQDSVRTVTLDSQTRELWREWQSGQAKEREQWSGEKARVESNRARGSRPGEPLHPDWISRRFNRLVELSGLPPIRLHDTRRLSAVLALLGKADIKVVQEWLGHSSRQITSDTYTSVLPQLLTAENGIHERRRPTVAEAAPGAGQALRAEGTRSHGAGPGCRRRWPR